MNQLLTSIIMKRLWLQRIETVWHAKGWKSVHMVGWRTLQIRHRTYSGSVVPKTLREMRRIRRHLEKKKEKIVQPFSIKLFLVWLFCPKGRKFPGLESFPSLVRKVFHPWSGKLSVPKTENQDLQIISP